MDTGKNKTKVHNQYQAAVLTISTSCSRGERDDVSGRILQELVRKAGLEIVEIAIIPDDREIIRKKLIIFSDESDVDIILTTGGTGPGPYDLTPEATAAVCPRLIPGIGELMRAEGGKKTLRAYLSRGIAGIRGNTLIVNLPGSPRAVRESMEAISGILIHALKMIAGGGHDD
ncbi:MAG: MogA/MoaB family molybdenum cofactor biosynthesis protein [Candidatus Auribacterota bacterium]|nr:MogA/MoaB family molybdenum cofactor biosynthesis protein [Candidatus Auribacterota bacterium]